MHGGASSLVFQLMLMGGLLSRFDNRQMGLLLHRANQGLDNMSDLLESGKVVPIIQKCFPFNQFVEALRYYGDGKAKGKVVITME